MTNEELPSIVIGLPSCGFVRTETTSALLYMMAETQCQYQVSTPMSCYIHMNRTDVIKQALSVDAKYVLFVDADMYFPPDALNKMLALDKDVVSATYNFRKYPLCSVVKLHEDYDSDYTVDETVTERPIPLNKIKNPFRVGAAGTGLMLIKTEIFKNLPKPWFFFVAENEEENISPIGEDIWFCNLARTHGYEIWIDPSINVGHIGTVMF
jgi:glycosyltransferase involved in cell wall biosynthesis